MIEHLSPSTVQSYRKCARSVYLGKVLKLPNATKYAATGYGKAMHAAIEALLIAKKDGKELSLDDMQMAFETEWIKESADVTIWNEDSPLHLMAQGKLACKDFHQQIAPTLNPLHIEKRYDLQRGEGKMPILCFADLVTDDGYVVDFKFGRGFSGSADSTEYMVNMATYSTAYKEAEGTYPIIRIVKANWSGSLNKETRKKKWSHKGYTVEQLQMGAKTVAYYMGMFDIVETGIRAGVYLPATDGNGLCKECGFRVSGACDIVLPKTMEVMKTT